jgi:hypothetical protein
VTELVNGVEILYDPEQVINLWSKETAPGVSFASPGLAMMLYFTYTIHDPMPCFVGSSPKCAVKTVLLYWSMFV